MTAAFIREVSGFFGTGTMCISQTPCLISQAFKCIIPSSDLSFLLLQFSLKTK